MYQPFFRNYLSGLATALSAMLLMLAPASAQTVFQSSALAGAASSSKPAFTLPGRLRAQYSIVGKYGRIPLSGTGLLSWDSRIETTASALAPYEASLEIGALFYKSTLTSKGIITATGIHPRNTDEKVTGKRLVSIATDVANARVSVSGKEGFLPFDANGQDLLTVMAQLGTNIQTLPQWRLTGAQQAFSVYRPSGIKRWRFQSLGAQTMQINGIAVNTIYVQQIPDSAAQDLDDTHHFWLDPTRHGFPVKLRKVTREGDFVELTLKDWQ